MDKAKQIKDLEDLYKAGGISYADLKLRCMEIMQNEEAKHNLFQLRGFGKDCERIIRDVEIVEEQFHLNRPPAKAGLVNEFAKEFKTTPPSQKIESIALRIALKFDKEVCEFAIERKTKKVYAFSLTHFSENGCTVDYRFFDETEEGLAREFAKSNHPTGYQIMDFSRILAMSDEEFERIVGSTRNAETVRKYRQVMRKKELEECAKKLLESNPMYPVINRPLNKDYLKFRGSLDEAEI